jgi:hypothetical protein
MRPPVNREQLLQTLRTNRDEHHAVYTEALAAYRSGMVAWHREQVAAIQDGRKVHRYAPSSLPEPEDHTADYDRTIQMLEWAVSDTVEIDEQAFTELVLDEWSWSGRWRDSTHSYTSR